jgi:hypothetical protein
VNKSLDELQRLREETIRSISREAGKALKTLLEEKHIYQQVVIDAKSLITAWEAKARSLGATIHDGDADFEKTRFTLPDSQLDLADRWGPPEGSPVLTMIVSNTKLFCSACDEREVFSPVWYRDMANELNKPVAFAAAAGRTPPKDGFQLLYITLQCQRCLGQPAGFIVRRDGWKLSLHGRSPMEHVEVPKYIPKEERHLFRDAMIAAHGGKILAALFYLRVFIEQFARRVTGETERRFGADLMEDYGKTLPDPHRGTRPSLKELYEKLSEPIHAAREDEKLFEAAREAIEHHFEIRKVFKISEAPAKSGAQS